MRATGCERPCGGRILGASVVLEDEIGREYSLRILASLSSRRAIVPVLWFYEVGNGLLMAYRRQRITFAQAEGFLARLKALSIAAAQANPSEILQLPILAEKYKLTSYDAAYLSLAIALQLPLATKDTSLSHAAMAAGVAVVTV